MAFFLFLNFKSLFYFLTPQDTPGLAYIFPTPVLESAISLRSSGSFRGKNLLILEIKIWALGMFTATEMLLLLSNLGLQSKKKRVYCV